MPIDRGLFAINTLGNIESFTCPEFLAMEHGVVNDFTDCIREAWEETKVCIRTLNNEEGSAFV
ncbi:hypothetical protein ABTK28_21345, partial [Acinetobacter baumannii]